MSNWHSMNEPQYLYNIRLNYQLYLNFVVDGATRKAAIQNAKELGERFLEDLSSHTAYHSAHFYKVCESDTTAFTIEQAERKIAELRAEQEKIQIMVDHVKRKR